MVRDVTYKKAYFPRRPTARPLHPPLSQTSPDGKLLAVYQSVLDSQAILAETLRLILVMERLLYSRQGEPVCYLLDSYITNFTLESLSGGVYFLTIQHMGSSEHIAEQYLTVTLRSFPYISRYNNVFYLEMIFSPEASFGSRVRTVVHK